MKFVLFVLSLAILLTACRPADIPENQAAASAYCLKNQGNVESRYPYYDTNSQTPLQMAGELEVCTFTANDQSRVSVDLVTLYAEKPTLAALAYLKNPPVEGATSYSDYCSKLGGSDRFGRASDAGGGWGNKDGKDVISLCVFPDLSVIDSFALTQHASGIARGADLTSLLRYKDQTRKPFQ
jgi:putative hemolysin